MARRRSDIPPQQADASPVLPAWQREGRTYILGIDALTLDVIAPMIERGDLPNFARLANEGCHGPLGTVRPTNSALLWTSIASGRHHRDHGIQYFTFHRLLGMRLSHRAYRRAKKRHHLGPVFRLLKQLRLFSSQLFDGRHVRVKRLWEILSEGGIPAGVVNWWNTWPAEPVRGFVVSDRVHYWRTEKRFDELRKEQDLTFPAPLLDAVRPLIVPPDEVSMEVVRRFVDLTDDELRSLAESDTLKKNMVKEVQYLVSADLTYRRIFVHCLDAFPDVKLAAVYFRGTDVAQHRGFHYMPSATRVSESAENRRKFGNVVPQAYRLADETAGAILARMRPEDTLFVMSDHGFAYEEHGGYYGHDSQPPGVLYACGNEFERGARFSGATIYDVAPTVLRVCGFPLALDLEGRCLEEYLTPAFRRDHPPLAPVASYGPKLMRHDSAPASNDMDKAIQDHLRGLGYLD